jgi:hypothetical protein
MRGASPLRVALVHGRPRLAQRLHQRPGVLLLVAHRPVHEGRVAVAVLGAHLQVGRQVQQCSSNRTVISIGSSIPG